MNNLSGREETLHVRYNNSVSTSLKSLWGKLRRATNSVQHGREECTTCFTKEKIRKGGLERLQIVCKSPVQKSFTKSTTTILHRCWRTLSVEATGSRLARVPLLCLARAAGRRRADEMRQSGWRVFSFHRRRVLSALYYISQSSSLMIRTPPSVWREKKTTTL